MFKAHRLSVLLAVFVGLFYLNISAQEKYDNVQLPDYSDWENAELEVNPPNEYLKLASFAKETLPQSVDFVLVWSDRNNREGFITYVKVSWTDTSTLMQVNYFAKINNTWTRCNNKNDNCSKETDTFFATVGGNENFSSVASRVLKNIFDYFNGR